MKSSFIYCLSLGILFSLLACNQPHSEKQLVPVHSNEDTAYANIPFGISREEFRIARYRMFDTIGGLRFRIIPYFDSTENLYMVNLVSDSMLPAFDDSYFIPFQEIISRKFGEAKALEEHDLSIGWLVGHKQVILDCLHIEKERKKLTYEEILEAEQASPGSVTRNKLFQTKERMGERICITILNTLM